MEHESLPDLPRVMNLGSGKSYDPQMFNVDINPQWHPDALIDLSVPQCLAQPHDCGRFGLRVLPAGHFSDINAFDVLEHVAGLTTMMANCLELLAEGGRLHIGVPYDLSLGAWQDPTHVRAFNENSWLYYSDWYWYLGWERARFDRESLTYVLSALGDRMQKNGASTDELVVQARAVDSMHVVLRKRALSADEAAHSRQMASRQK